MTSQKDVLAALDRAFEKAKTRVEAFEQEHFIGFYYPWTFQPVEFNLANQGSVLLVKSDYLKRSEEPWDCGATTDLTELIVKEELKTSGIDDVELNQGFSIKKRIVQNFVVAKHNGKYYCLDPTLWHRNEGVKQIQRKDFRTWPSQDRSISMTNRLQPILLTCRKLGSNYINVHFGGDSLTAQERAFLMHVGAEHGFGAPDYVFIIIGDERSENLDTLHYMQSFYVIWDIEKTKTRIGELFSSGFDISGIKEKEYSKIPSKLLDKLMEEGLIDVFSQFTSSSNEVVKDMLHRATLTLVKWLTQLGKPEDIILKKHYSLVVDDSLRQDFIVNLASVLIAKSRVQK